MCAELAPWGRACVWGGPLGLCLLSLRGHSEVPWVTELQDTYTGGWYSPNCLGGGGGEGVHFIQGKTKAQSLAQDSLKSHSGVRWGPA